KASMRITLRGAFGTTERRCARRILASSSISPARRPITSSNSAISSSEKLDACRMKRSVTSPSIWARRSGATFATAASISLVLIAGAMDRAASFAAPSSRDLPHELLAGVRGEIELGGGLRPIEQEALHLRAPGGAQQFKLFGGLHALARGIELERAAEPCHRADDRRAVRPVGELGHERLVD